MNKLEEAKVFIVSKLVQYGRPLSIYSILGVLDRPMVLRKIDPSSIRFTQGVIEELVEEGAVEYTYPEDKDWVQLVKGI